MNNKLIKIVMNNWFTRFFKKKEQNNSSEEKDNTVVYTDLLKQFGWIVGQQVVYVDDYSPEDAYLMTISDIDFFETSECFDFSLKNENRRRNISIKADKITDYILFDKWNSNRYMFGIKHMPSRFIEDTLDPIIKRKEEGIKDIENKLREFELFDTMVEKRDFDSFLNYYIYKETARIKPNRDKLEHNKDLYLQDIEDIKNIKEKLSNNEI